MTPPNKRFLHNGLLRLNADEVGTWVKVLFLVTGALLALGPGQASRKKPELTSKADINTLQYKLSSEIGKDSTQV